MAQRFAIDGNFTQSFVGTVSLNAEACPADTDNFATLFYDLGNGAVCYVTSSTDFCFEFFFDSENTIPLSKVQTNNAEQASPPEQSFQFVGTATGGPFGSRSQPRTSLDDTFYIMFDSSSANAGDLKNYLIQNVGSGSLKLSTTTEAVQINYTAQTLTGSKDNKIILGNSNNIPTASNPQFTVLTTTSDIPFSQGERVCVEILTSGGGGTSTTFQTGSAGVQTQLSNLIIKDFDSNVFVTSDPVTGQLTLQFGTPQEPTSLVGSLVGFVDDRFNKETNSYNGRLTYNLNGTTFVSASLIDVTGGGQIVDTSNDGDGDINFDAFLPPDPQTTGSRTFKASLRVQLADLSEQSFETSNFSGTLNKSLPTNPSLTVTSLGNAIQGGFHNDPSNLSAPSTSSNDFLIHIGATGSITIRSGSGTANDWEAIGVAADNTTNSTGTDTLNFTTATNEDSGKFRKAYQSPSGDNDPQLFYTASRFITSNRKFVWKFGAAPTASLVRGVMTDLHLLQQLGFQSSSNNNGFDEDPLGESFTIQGGDGDFHYLIVKDTVGDSTPTIKVEGLPVDFPQQSHYTNIDGSVGYRVFNAGAKGTAAVTYTYSSD